MKKMLTAIVALAIIFALVSCNEVFAPKGQGEVEYTDVVYSEDGSLVTLYLDGIGVPLSESGRAMNRDMAQMNYEYLEAVFVDGNTIARASWNIGERAGISGVSRTASGVSYAAISGTTAAVMFVGMTDGTVMGIGNLTHINDPAASGTGRTNLTTADTSVTFTVTAIRTKLNPDSTTGFGAGDNTFYTAWNGQIIAGTATNGATAVQMTSIDGLTFPIYSLPASDWNGATTVTPVVTPAIYNFVGEAGPVGSPVETVFPHTASVIVTGAGTAQKRNARYVRDGQYRYPPSDVYTSVVVYMRNNQTASTIATPVTFIPAVTLEFDTTAAGTGIFTFNISIPVNAITMAPSTNGGPGPNNWYMRSGWDRFFYNLDNGISAGGCTLMGVNVSSIEFLEIYNVWNTGTAP